MAVSLLKKWISYLFEIRLAKAESGFSGHLEVLIRDGKIKLTTDNTIYSYEEKYSVYADTFAKIDALLPPLKNGLILGYGLGSIPLILYKTYQKEMHFVGIEIDQEIIRFADKYGFSKNVELVCTDAFDFVRSDSQKYDLICIDLFIDAVVPEQFETEEFLKSCLLKLNPGGILLFNRLGLTPLLKIQSECYFRDVFEPLCNQEARIIKTGMNLVLFYQKSDFE